MVSIFFFSRQKNFQLQLLINFENKILSERPANNLIQTGGLFRLHNILLLTNLSHHYYYDEIVDILSPCSIMFLFFAENYLKY